MNSQLIEKITAKPDENINQNNGHKRYKSPIVIFIGIILSIYFCELLVMLILPLVPIIGSQHSWTESITDSTLLVVLLLPIIYLFLYKPLSERSEIAETRARELQSLMSKLTLAEHRERRRLAEIIHDHLQQFLIAAKMSCESILMSCGLDQNENANKVKKLINQSIKISRTLTAELSPPFLAQNRLSDALKWLVDWIKDNQGMTIELQIIPGNDPGREDITVFLFQSARELLLNVIKHAGVNSAKLKLNRNQNNQLCMSVTDHGSGFDTTALWDRAKTVSGFGLFSIRERANLFGGSLEVESSPENGSSLTLVVPLEIAEVEEAEPVSKDIAKGYSKKHPGEKICVLLVDDHSVVRQGLASVLSFHQDIEIVGEASNGEEAIRLTQKIVPDVILMDINMPKMNGIEATRKIHSEFPDIRIIGLSMYGEDEQAGAMARAGATAYRSKSDNTDLLLATIRGETE